MCILSGFIILLVSGGSPRADDFSGVFNLSHSKTESKEDGGKTEVQSLNENLYLNFRDNITSNLSYQLLFRGNMRDTENSDAGGSADKTYQRSIDPSLDLFLNNPMYNLAAGYRRQENWSTASLSNEGRDTAVFYYSRLNLAPHALPTLTLNYERREDFDHVSPETLDRSSDEYTVTSAYTLPSRDIDLRYYLNYSHDIEKDRISTPDKTVIDAFSANYTIGYSDTFWQDRASYSLVYNGNYARSKTRQEVTRTGSFEFERTPLGGFRGVGNAAQNNVDVLSSDGNLVNEDFITPTAINLSASQYSNIGILVSSNQSVDKLYIYVNKNVAGDVLNNISSWRVFRSDFNQAGTWQEITASVAGVQVTVFDIASSIYRFEISFSTPRKASYFNIINRFPASTANVEVTEIEAYGTDQFQSDELTDVVTSFVQGVSFNSAATPISSVDVSLHYSLDRTDTNPVSVPDSVAGIFRNVFSDAVSGGRSDFTSRITRNYGASATWRTHRLLTTSLDYQRNENFDNPETVDTASNTYNLSFQSDPLPTLNTTLTLLRNDSFSFGEHDTSNDSILLSTGAQLYEDIHMISDIGYTTTESILTDSASGSRFITIAVDARITRTVSGTLNYGYTRTTGEISSDSSTTLATINYQPGRFINISGNVRMSDTDGDQTVSESLLLDWLILPAVRMNFNYEHINAEPAPSSSDSVNSLILWHVTRFADVRFSYGYTVVEDDTRTEDHNYNTTLNCRF